MNIVQQTTQDGTLKVLVDSLSNRKKIEKLLLLLSKDVSYEISFLNLKILPAKIILRLQEIKNNTKIIADDLTLRYYLRNLGFNVVNKEHQTLDYREKTDKVQYIALGGSAGSLQKFIDIITHLEPSNITLFIVMHQRADVKSSLVEILQRVTNHYKVVEARSDIKVMPSTIYVAPPTHHMIVAGGFLFLTDDTPKNYSKPSISTTFESLAYEYKESLLSILVCGYGSDGSDSLEHIRKTGGTVIIEQLHECKATPMLENAIFSKEYDFILSISDINKLLFAMIKKTDNIEPYMDEFLDEIYDVYGYDYRHYHRSHILRRVERSYHLFKMRNFPAFKEKVLNDIEVFQDLFLNISVNITTLFRNPNVYKQLREEILPTLKDKNSIKIWCAGCSSGEEPYSIAIILKELGLLEKSLIYATDLNDIILQQAINGIYAKDSYKLFNSHYKDAGGSGTISEHFTEYEKFVVVDDSIKEKILFFRHNLVTDGVLNEFQLLFCRNVIIYFDNTLKTRVFNLFDHSLAEDGILVLGESEAYDKRRNFQLLDNVTKIYKKSAT